eukprot:11625535-Heterocapsa_arctica.AAC.1
MPAATDSGSSSPPYLATENMDIDEDEEAAAEPVADAEVIPLAPPPLSVPPWLALSIDTIEHNIRFYLPPGRSLESYTTAKDGGKRLDSLTTREIMSLRRIWDPTGTGEWTIPPWATHLTNAVCKTCCVREYSTMFGVDRVCNYCGQATLVFAYEDL